MYENNFKSFSLNINEIRELTFAYVLKCKYSYE